MTTHASSDAPSLSKRGDLERRGDLALSRLDSTLVTNPDRSIALVREDGVRVIANDLAAVVLVALGLEDTIAEIARERRRRPGTLPAVVIVDDFASVAFVQLQAMSPGGVS